jgi:hypothetical protein
VVLRDAKASHVHETCASLAAVEILQRCHATCYNGTHITANRLDLPARR